MEKLRQKLGQGPGFFLTSPLWLNIKIIEIWDECQYELWIKWICTNVITNIRKSDDWQTDKFSLYSKQINKG